MAVPPIFAIDKAQGTLAGMHEHEKAAWDHSRRLCVSCEMCGLFVLTRQYIRGRLELEALERIDPVRGRAAPAKYGWARAGFQ